MIDCYDEETKTIYDWKTGATQSDSYASGMQPKVYQILIPEAVKAEIHHYDQHARTTDMSIVHLTKQTLEEAVNWVVTLSAEMHDYLTENKLYERFAS